MKLDAGNGGARWVNDFGHALFEEVKLIIGNLEIDKMDDLQMHIEELLSTPSDLRTDSLTLQSQSTATLTTWGQGQRLLYVDLPWYFTQHPGYHLPTVGMYLSKIELQVKLRKKEDLIVSGGGAYDIAADPVSILDFGVSADLFLLSEAEQNYFADGAFFHVVTQHQHWEGLIRAGQTSQRVQFELSHPVKELNIVFRKTSNVAAKSYYNFSGDGVDPFPSEAFESMYLQINQSDYMEPTDPLYYRLLENKMHHTVVPDKHIYTISFGMYPQLLDSTGTLNFSRLDKATLIIKFPAALSEDYEIHIIAKSINGMTIENGVTRMEFGG